MRATKREFESACRVLFGTDDTSLLSDAQQAEADRAAEDWALDDEAEMDLGH